MTTAFLTKTSVLAAVLLGATTSASAQSTSVTPVPIDRNVLHVQVILDHLGFGPGVLDGRGGQSLVAALKGFQEAKGWSCQSSTGCRSWEVCQCTTP